VGRTVSLGEGARGGCGERTEKDDAEDDADDDAGLSSRLLTVGLVYVGEGVFAGRSDA